MAVLVTPALLCMAGNHPRPGMMRSEARYVRQMAAPPGFMMGPKRCNMDTKEYADALIAARSPCKQRTVPVPFAVACRYREVAEEESSALRVCCMCAFLAHTEAWEAAACWNLACVPLVLVCR